MKLRAYIAALHAALFAILLAVSPAGSGSMTLLGAGKPSAAVASYTGPGDVVDYSSGAYYGLRAYSSATRGQKLVNVCDITGGTVNGACVDLVSDATTGAIVPQTVGTNSVTCPGANCGIKLFYDLTAAGNCGGSCDMAAKSTAATMSTLTTGCAGQSTHTYCSTGVGSPYSSGANTFTPGVNPIFVSASGIVNNTGSEEALIGGGGGFIGLGVFGAPAFYSADQTFTFKQIAAQAGAYHAFAGNADTTTASYLTSDATVATGTALNVTNSARLINVGGVDSLATAGQIFLEGGISKAGPTSGTATSLNSNSKTFWGF